MALGFAMPEFADGVPLSALELNKLSTAHRYIDGLQPFNYGSKEINLNDPRVILHRFRYLHWFVHGAVDASLRINNSTVATAIGTGLSGVVDLNAVSGLVVGLPYTVAWIGNAVTGIYLLEHQESGGGLTYPQAIPNFASTVPADKLNALAVNTQYLLDYRAGPIQAGFARCIYPFITGPSEATGRRRYWIRRMYRYLYVSWTHTQSGSSGFNRTDRIYLNGQSIYEATPSSSVPGDLGYTIAMDWNNTDHYVYEAPAGVTSVVSLPGTMPAVGNWYQVEVYGRVGNNSDVADHQFATIVGEMPVRAYI